MGRLAIFAIYSKYYLKSLSCHSDILDRCRPKAAIVSSGGTVRALVLSPSDFAPDTMHFTFRRCQPPKNPRFVGGPVGEGFPEDKEMAV